MRADASGRRQRAVMATDAEWERIGRAAAESGMDLSRFVIHRALDWDPLPPEVLRRAVREMLVLARLEERRLRGAGAGRVWEDACDAVDEWIEREGMLEGLTDPGAANRWNYATLVEAFSVLRGADHRELRRAFHTWFSLLVSPGAEGAVIEGFEEMERPEEAGELRTTVEDRVRAWREVDREQAVRRASSKSVRCCTV